MTRTLTSGKKRGLAAVADARGVIAALAIDQRGAMRTLFGEAMGVAPESVPGEKLIRYKEAVSRALTPLASAILLDPEYGLPAARIRAKNAGLLLAYEKTGYDPAVKGRMPALLERWSAQRLVEAGADSVKLLLYYATSSDRAVNDTKHAFIERVGAECAACDVPFFLELVTYAEGVEDKSPLFARLKPDVVTRSMVEFSKPCYRVDILKVGVPVSMNYVEGSPSAVGEILYTRELALAEYRRAAAAATIPFIYLSQGVSNETFQYALELAAEAQVNFSGVLCGRATWRDGVEVFVKNGEAALEDWLGSTGVGNIENVNRHLRAAGPWYRGMDELVDQKA